MNILLISINDHWYTAVTVMPNTHSGNKKINKKGNGGDIFNILVKKTCNQAHDST